MDQAMPKAKVVIASLEMLLYGGLIASRTSNDTTDVVMQRVGRLLQYHQWYPDV